MTEEAVAAESTNRSIVGPVIAALIAVALGALIVQNTDSTPVQWLWFHRTAPLWIVIFSAALAGAVLSEALAWVLRRARRR